MLRIALVALPLLVVACGQNTEPAPVAVANDTMVTDDAGVADTEDQLPANSDPWSVKDVVDPMDDARVITASTSAAGQSNDIQVQVSCTAGKPTIRYEVSGFDKDGDGARLATSFGSGGPTNKIMIRADDSPAKNVFTQNSQYNNQAIIDGEYLQYVGTATAGFDAAAARTLTLRVQFSNSSETYQLDQSTENFRKTVKPCLVALQEKLDERASAAAAAAAQQVQSQPTQEAEPAEGSAAEQISNSL